MQTGQCRQRGRGEVLAPGIEYDLLRSKSQVSAG
jgi:hypothetical protein